MTQIKPAQQLLYIPLSHLSNSPRQACAIPEILRVRSKNTSGLAGAVASDIRWAKADVSVWARERSWDRSVGSLARAVAPTKLTKAATIKLDTGAINDLRIAHISFLLQSRTCFYF